MESIQKNQNTKNTPENKFRAGPIVATIWNNETTGKEGQIVSYKTISCQRTYKDKNDQWQSTSAMRMNDLPKAILVMTKAYEYLALAEDEKEEAS